MTGFGRAEFEVNNKKFTIEIKSLNSKQLDINTRLPLLYREKEIQIRRTISDILIRGKIDLIIYSESLGEDSSSKINIPVVKGYFDQLSKLSKETGVGIDNHTLLTILRLPDAVKTDYETLDENEWGIILENIKSAIQGIENFRTQEGKALQEDVAGNITKINQLLDQIGPFEKQRLENLKSRLTDNMDGLKLNGNVDQNRFEQELIFYLEKLDINEEKVRLANHCRYFYDTMIEPDSNGKKLGFISQEIGREINTIGSKANDSDIQRIVVQMKDYLERIKEQLLNVL